MSEESKRGLRIFLQYWALLGVLAGFNLYLYFKRGSALSLILAVVCSCIFIGWVFFYIFYVRREK